jgi:hypothetical protein
MLQGFRGPQARDAIVERFNALHLLVRPWSEAAERSG